jgi:hypothetical protein
VDAEFSGGMRFPEAVRAEIDGVSDKLECGRLQGSRDSYTLEWFTSLGCRVFTHGIPWDGPVEAIQKPPVKIIIWREPEDSAPWQAIVVGEGSLSQNKSKEKLLAQAVKKFGSVEVLNFEDYKDGADNFDVLRWFEEGCPVKILS